MVPCVGVSVVKLHLDNHFPLDVTDGGVGIDTGCNQSHVFDFVKHDFQAAVQSGQLCRSYAANPVGDGEHAELILVGSGHLLLQCYQYVAEGPVTTVVRFQYAITIRISDTHRRGAAIYRGGLSDGIDMALEHTHTGIELVFQFHCLSLLVCVRHQIVERQHGTRQRNLGKVDVRIELRQPNRVIELQIFNVNLRKFHEVNLPRLEVGHIQILGQSPCICSHDRYLTQRDIRIRNHEGAHLELAAIVHHDTHPVTSFIGEFSIDRNAVRGVVAEGKFL